MIFRPTTPSELDRFLPLVRADAAGGMTADTYTARLAAGEYRPDWTWIAEDAPGATPLALAVWWGDPDEDLPGALDGLFVHDAVRSEAERTDLAAGLLSAGHAAHAAAGASAAPNTTSRSPVTGTTGPTRPRPWPGGRRRPGAPASR